MQIALTIPPAELAVLSQQIAEMQRATGADMKKVVRNTARDLTFALIRYTPVAKKKQSMRKKGTAKYWIMLYHRYTGEITGFYGSKTQADQYGLYGLSKPVYGRGYAKAVWLKALRGLGVPPRSTIYKRSAKQTREPAAYGIFIDQLSRPLNPGVTVGNAVPYIGKLDVRARIIQQASRHVAAKMAQRVEAMTKRHAQRFTGGTVRGFASSAL